MFGTRGQDWRWNSGAQRMRERVSEAHAWSEEVSYVSFALVANLGVHLLARGVVYGQLQRDHDVVLHAADLAVERDARLAEGVRGLLELQRVDVHLLAEARGVFRRSFREQLRHDADPLLAQHRVQQRAHAVLDVLCRENAVALRGVVDAVARAGNALERAMVVLGLYLRYMYISYQRQYYEGTAHRPLLEGLRLGRTAHGQAAQRHFQESSRVPQKGW